MVPDAKIDLKPGANPAGNPKDNYLDLTRVEEDFAFVPSYPIERGIPDYMAWLRDHAQ
jgi:UDP-glucose 4-epimerase